MGDNCLIAFTDRAAAGDGDVYICLFICSIETPETRWPIMTPPLLKYLSNVEVITYTATHVCVIRTR